jgi:hypothetical protein
MTRRFHDKVVIITGGSQGVGAAAARAFAREGAKLVLVARGRGPLEAIAAELGAIADVTIEPLDVTDRAGCRQMLERAHSRYGRIDVLVNDAAYHARGPVETVDPDALARMVEVNLIAPLYLSRLVLPYIAASGGAIVNIASLNGIAPMPGVATYSASKVALRYFSRALAEELEGRNIRVSLVSPGGIETGFLLDQLEEADDIAFSQPMSTAEQVAAAILDAAESGRVETFMPRMTAMLAFIALLFPGLARRLRPRLRAKGAKVKEQYRRSRSNPR